MIFDQFEEFFTTNQHRWQERRPFFDQLAQALLDLPTMKVVFVMREEYIAQLETFAELLPEKLRPRMHLERLRGNSARNAVVKPFQNMGSFLRCERSRRIDDGTFGDPCSRRRQIS